MDGENVLYFVPSVEVSLEMANCEFCQEYTQGTILIYKKGSINICAKSKCKEKALLAYG